MHIECISLHKESKDLLIFRLWLIEVTQDQQVGVMIISGLMMNFAFYILKEWKLSLV